ncbi:MAG: hypothetical protein HFE65_01960 [Clostridiales bacterium]|nr:hypothetical protein [Clostridiales bacterium]
MILYTESPYDRFIETMMIEIPGFQPRGHGVYISQSELLLSEKQQPPPASLTNAIKRTMSHLHCQSFQRRLKQYLKESEEIPMDYRNEEHRIAFMEAIEKLNRKDYALMSAVYLLTAEHALWMKAKQRVRQNKICFNAIKLQNSTENAYTLFCCAKDLYLGTKHITIKDLADKDLIAPRIFDLICNAMAIRRFGLAPINSNKERNICND